MSARDELAFPSRTDFADVFNEKMNPLAAPTIHPGLTKRELFAAMAMQGLCGSDEFMRRALAGAEAGTDIGPLVAKSAVFAADLLLAALQSPPPEAQP